MGGGGLIKTISFRCGVCQDFTVWYYPDTVTNEQLNAWRDRNVREHVDCEPADEEEEEEDG